MKTNGYNPILGKCNGHQIQHLMTFSLIWYNGKNQLDSKERLIQCKP